MRAVVVLPMPGQLDETNIGVDGALTNPGVTRLRVTVAGCSFKDTDADGAQLQGR